MVHADADGIRHVEITVIPTQEDRTAYRHRIPFMYSLNATKHEVRASA